MEKLSVTIITLNEEENIRDALESVTWADEIIIVDSGSSDKTIDICKEYTEKIFYNPWPGHITQKNIAIDKAAYLWILSIDADERITPELAKEIKEVLQYPKADAYAMPRHVFYLGRWIYHSGWYPDYKVRLFKKNNARWGGVNPHDTVIVDGKLGHLNGNLVHYSYKNISHHVNTINNFTTISAGEYLKLGKRASLWNITLRPAGTFLKKYILKQGFRDGLPGFIIAVSSAYYVFLKYAKLWELINIIDYQDTKKGIKKR
ncbi:MAG: glycosyltransferase family 2 protein [Candidatus Brocadia sp.]|nr:glycosyltransferase family 2 protein [Candidatus Brocadia sp.]UJS18856.1 MAG: glycosyltransferase family 2 protein [Candidatus Jettenia sp.]